MLRLAAVLYPIIGTTLAGSAMAAALIAGYDTLYPVLITAAIGAVIGLPITYFVTKAILDN